MRPKLFGSSGIRGVFGREVTPELGVRLGMAIGSDARTAVVGWDVRRTSPALASAVTSGLMSAGCGVGIAGMVPTPTLARAAAPSGAGVMVTASHNPPEYNGFKLWNPDGMAYDRAQSDEIERRLASGKFRMAEWECAGDVHEVQDAVRGHVGAIARKVGPIKAKVVVDCGNGAASVVTPYMLRELGCEVVALNADPDGAFPGRGSEPVESALWALKKSVVATGARLGLAHDGDADRVVAVDEKGNFLDGDMLLPILAAREVRRALVVPVDASMAFEEMLGEGRVHRCKVGDVYVAEAIKKHGADFGGEPSGTFIFPGETYCPDGIYAAARIAAIAAETPLSKLAKGVPRHPTFRERVPYDASKRDAVEAKLLAALRKIRPLEIQTLDGARGVFDDGWLLVRPSGTEPKVKIYVEGKDRAAVKRLSGLARAIVREALA